MTAEVRRELLEFITEEKITEYHADTLYGNVAKWLVRPDSEQEILDVIRYANKTGKKLAVEGAGSKKGFGGLLKTADICLSMADYKGIVEHVAGDMTITVKAGTPFREIQRYLAAFRQMVALDPFAAEKATIGGVIASNDSGPKRLGYGSARDSVIGMRLAYPDGKIIRAGGKVVKNVAGYDMNKLFIGSMGTLAVITEITLKLRPMAKYESAALIRFPDGSKDTMKEFSVRVLDSMLEPLAFEMLTPGLAGRLTGEHGDMMVIGFADVQTSVQYQEAYLRKLLPEGAKMSTLSGPELNRFWEAFYSAYPDISDVDMRVLRFGVKSMDIAEILEEAGRLEKEWGLTLYGHGGIGHGLGHIYVNGETAAVREFIAALRAFLSGRGGYLTIKQASHTERTKLDVWGPPPAHQFLLDAIKDKIDPNRVLNYQRFVGGV
ncbi:MAG: FAD-binding oxidoreductase [Bacillus sp. (in: firmicutes)]